MSPRKQGLWRSSAPSPTIRKLSTGFARSKGANRGITQARPWRQRGGAQARKQDRRKPTRPLRGDSRPAAPGLAGRGPAIRHHVSNYSADAGQGSNTITTLSENTGWRTALLGTVAAGALWLSLPRYARGDDACILSGGTTATCTGDQSDGIASGIDFPATYTTLNVNNLTTNIAPASGVDGIYFRNTFSIAINSDTGPFDIIANGSTQTASTRVRRAR